MRIKTCRDDKKIGREIIERGQDQRLHGIAKLLRPVAGAQGRVEDIAHSPLGPVTGAGIERHLMRGTIEKLRVGPEYLLGSVAVMHVEINDRDTLRVIGVAGMVSGYGGVVEQAEAHGASRLRMMTWRTNGTEGVLRFAAHDGIDSADGAACAAQCRIKTPGRHPCIGIELLQAFIRGSLMKALEMLIGMGAKDLRLAGNRRLFAQQRVETRGRENAVDDLEPLGAFGMALGRLMLDA